MPPGRAFAAARASPVKPAWVLVRGAPLRPGALSGSGRRPWENRRRRLPASAVAGVVAGAAGGWVVVGGEVPCRAFSVRACLPASKRS